MDGRREPLLARALTGKNEDPAYLASVIRERVVTTVHFVPPRLRVSLDEPTETVGRPR
jgi:hypothetical protein